MSFMRLSYLSLILLAALSSLPGCSGSRGPANNGTNVLLIVLDTVRADRFSCYGNTRPTTPGMDLVAQNGIRFENFYANSSWTLASHASLFTGTYPARHRATQETLSLDEGLPTLAEILAEAGYETFGTSLNGVVSIKSGLTRGFETFVEAFRREFKATISGETGHLNNIAFGRFLKSSDRERPFFAFLNYISAHAPYTPPEPYRSRILDSSVSDTQVTRAAKFRMADHYMDGSVTEEDFSVLNQLYDGEINFLDDHIIRLLNILKEDGRLEETLVIITSDHGENIGDHGHFAHVFNIYNTLLHIPLIVVLPQGRDAGEVRSDTAQLLDLFPTILRQCGVDYNQSPEGRDLFADGADAVKADVMAEYYYPRQVLSVFDRDEIIENLDRFAPYMRRLRTIQNGEHKLIWGSDGSRQLFEIGKTPGETDDLLAGGADHPMKSAMLARLEALLEAHHGDVPIDPVPPVGWMVSGMEEEIDDPELIERLRSLGYVK